MGWVTSLQKQKNNRAGIIHVYETAGPDTELSCVSDTRIGLHAKH